MNNRRDSISFKIFLAAIIFVAAMVLRMTPVFAASSCEDLFASDALSENSIFKAEQQRVEINYGGKLEVEQSEGKNGLKFIIIKDNKTNQEIAELNYRYSDETKQFTVKYIEATKKQLGLAHLLFTAALTKHPEAKTISTTMLLETNEQVVRQALALGMSLENAIKETPSYKLGKSFGFDKILKDSITEDFAFVTEKSQ